MSPSYNHSYLAYRIAKLIDQEDKFNIHLELTIDIKGSDYIPDIALYEKKEIDFLHDKIKTNELPLAVIEIISPKQTVNEIIEKFEIYLAAGIKSCWLVIPPPRTLIIFNDINEPLSYSKGLVTDSVLNLQVRVEDIFK